MSLYYVTFNSYSSAEFVQRALRQTNFYDARLSKLTQFDVVGYTGPGTSFMTLDQTIHNNALGKADTATVISGSRGSAVLLGDFWLMNQTDQQNTLVHEMLHVYGFGGDDAIFNEFAGYGLQNSTGYTGTTGDISDWIGRGCKAPDK